MQATTYYKATSTQDAYDKLLANDKNVILGGGLWLKRINADYETIIDLANCGLDQTQETKDEFIIGSMVTLRQLETYGPMATYFNGVVKLALGSVMGVPLRNSATIGGTIMGKFPFSDIITPLLALDTTLVMYPHREVALKDFLKEKSKQKEILTEIHIKKEAGKALFKKVCLTELGFAILNVCVAKLDGKYRIAIGARPGVAALASQAMDLLNNHEVNDELIAKASELVTTELPYFDTNGNSKDYRKTLARVYTSRFLKEVK